ncbi:6,7-dimethyl-8-ribityllumazine synthase [Burkholderia plantarii]|uniref:6,7-dimethyl-8-ribityllumazine synthase n=1 Tax=Burkholderia plantarii TaxID=41899 RepID=UPI0018DD67D0|nr:6,7-dimethyl-8-ribityllumazine synthase [Burkholderia plantarii]MBI0329593.1 6,7-dimethyl-8-ribityllumazine synthase [Burkholderia plantarii]
MTQISSSSRAFPRRIAFVQSCWHKDIVDQCKTAFVAALAKAGVADTEIDFFEVAGAFEIPLHAKLLAKTGKYAAVACAGLVVDGGIYRHEFVAQAVISGLMQVQLETETVVLSAVLTPHHFHHGSHEHTTFFHEHFVVKGTELAHACADTIAKVAKLHATASGVADAEVLQAA